MRSLRHLLAMLICGTTLLACSMSGDGDEATKLESISFEADVYTISVGETISIPLVKVPDNAPATVTYKPSLEGIITLGEGSASGVVVTGSKGGNTVIIATAGSLTAYCTIIVKGSIEAENPYIVTPYSVVEVREGEKKAISVSLQGGAASDNSAFAWSIDSTSAATIDVIANTVVIHGNKSGSARITITHPKAEYSAELIVYILGTDESAVYVTTPQNVVNLKNTDTQKAIQATLIGGSESDKSNFFFQVVEGADVIKINYSNEVCSIAPVAVGSAKIRISHPKSAYSLDVLIVVSQSTQELYFELDNSFLILSGTESKTLLATFIGNDATQNDYYNFTYKVSDSSIIDIVQSMNAFMVIGKKAGAAVITIENTVTTFKREALVVVEDVDVTANEKYITTNQNVIQLSVGSTAFTLNMTLVGGTTADQNGFSWVIDDSSIIDVQTSDGTVTSRSSIRASVAGDPYETYKATALVTPKKVGTTRITISHPKSNVSSVVIVKVFPKGTFDQQPISIEAPKGLIPIQVGSSSNVTLTIASGTESSLGPLTWTSSNTSVALVVGSGLNAQINGLMSGIADVTVTGDNLYHPCVFKVLVGTEEEIKNANVIYVRQPYQNVTVGQSAYVTVDSYDEKLNDDDSYLVISSSPETAYVRMIGNRLVIQGLKSGTSELTVSNIKASNTVSLFITVEDVNVSLQYPYYLTSVGGFIGAVIDTPTTISVNLVGAPESEYSKIHWIADNNSICTLTPNGTGCVIKGNTSGQVAITVSHPKCATSKTIVVYFVASSDQLTSKIALSATDRNFLASVGQSFYLRVSTNATEAQKQQISWSVEDASILSVQDGSDYAYVNALSVGSTKITVTHPNAVAPLVFYISIVAEQSSNTSKTINLPSIIELFVGDNKVINASITGYTDFEQSQITWESSDSSIFTVTGSYGTGYVYAKKGGIGYLKVRHAPSGFSKDILVSCSKTSEEYGNKYLMSVESTYLRVRKGDTLTIPLIFGSNDFPELEKSQISWTCTQNGVINLYPNGDTAKIVAKEVGVSRITIQSPVASASVELSIEVNNSDDAIIPDAVSLRLSEQLKQIVLGDTTVVSVSLVDKNGVTQTTGLSSLVWEAEDPTIVSLSQVSNECRIKGMRAGQTYITISHPKALESLRLLLVVKESSSQIAYPLYIAKQNYILTVGESADIAITTADNNATQLAKIKWAFDSSGVLAYSKTDNRNFKVTGTKEGSSVIVVSHEYSAPVTIYVSVVKSTSSSSATIATESIISIVNGQNRETVLATNLDAAASSMFEWSSENTGIITVSGNGAAATIRAVSVGEAYITVSHPSYSSLKRKILVLIRNTQDELNTISAISVPKQHYTIQKNGQLTLSAFYGPEIPANLSGTTWSLTTSNNVIKLVPNGKTCSVTGLNVGIAKIEVRHPSSINTVILTIEVTSSSQGGSVEDSVVSYMTADQVFRIVEPGSSNVRLDFSVVGKNFDGDRFFEWTNNNPELIQVVGSGYSAFVTPLASSGVATVSVTNPKCSNVLTFTVQIGEKFTSNDGATPYIYVKKTVYHMGISDAAVMIEPDVRNVQDYNASNLQIQVAGSSNTVSYTKNIFNNKLYITVVPTGVGHIAMTLSHPSSPNKAVVDFIVDSPNSDNDSVYLTTTDNYNIISRGETKALSVSLVGYNEINSDAFKWSIDNSSVAYIIGTGTTVQLYGVGLGTAKITVTHNRCTYELPINVKVVENSVLENAVYLTTNENVIETVVSSSLSTLSVNLVGSTEYQNNFTWTVNNTNVLDVVGNGNSAFYRGKAAGTAKITISHPKASYELNIVVVVNNPVENALFLSTETPLVKLTPGTRNSKVTVKLEGGGAGDDNSIGWSIYNQNPSDTGVAQAGGKVITLTSGGGSGLVSAVNEGTAVIKVTHPRSEKSLFITVYVSQYESIAFTSKTMTAVQGSMEFVGLNIPNYENNSSTQVYYSSDNPAVCTVTGTSKVAVINAKAPGFAIVKATLGNSLQTTEMAVTVQSEESPGALKIITGQTTYLLNPRAAQQALTARLNGPGVVDTDNDSLVWSVADPTLLTVFPSSGKGREIRVSPIKEGETTITISHAKTNITKTIYFKITEADNSFTLSKNILTIDTGSSTTLSASISGGTYSDYESIAWAASKKMNSDGTYQEIVRVMGTGKTVQLYGVNNGTSTVTAFFNGKLQSCTIVVQADKYFSFTVNTISLYPGEVTEVPYNLRPENSSVVWYTSDMGTTDPVMQYVDNAGQKKIQITALKEGNVILTGVSNGTVSKLNITIAWDFRVTGDYYVSMKPSEKNKVINYTVYPPNTYLKLAAAIPNVLLDVMPPDPKTGKGTIILSTVGEVANAAIKFNQLRSDKVTSTGKTFTVALTSKYGDESLTPRFVRYDGYWSNGTDPNWNKPSASNIESIPVVNNTYQLTLGDGETHYIILDRKYEDSYLANLSFAPAADLAAIPGIDIAAVNLEGKQAIRISHKTDNITYNRVALSHDYFWTITYYSIISTTPPPSQSDPNPTPSWHEGYAVKTWTVNVLDASASFEYYGVDDGGHNIMGYLFNIPAYPAKKYLFWTDRLGGDYDGTFIQVDPFSGNGVTYKLPWYQGRNTGKGGEDYGLNTDSAGALRFKSTVQSRSEPRILPASSISGFPFYAQGSFSTWPSLTNSGTRYSHAWPIPSYPMPSISTSVTQTTTGLSHLTYSTIDGDRDMPIRIIFASRPCHRLFNPNDRYVNLEGSTVAREYRGAY